MHIKFKPVPIKLRQLKNNKISVETPLASLTLNPEQFNFLTQGLAYSPRPFTLDAPNRLKKKFETILRSQLCVSHLSANVSPFLANYLTNKTFSPTDGRSFRSLLDQLAGSTQRLLFCGAGPSLYESWDFVEFCLNTGYARVVAGGSAIKAFADRGLSPDLCLVCDPNPSVASRGDVPESFAKSTILLAGSGVNPKLLANWRGPVALTTGLSTFPFADYLEPGSETLHEGNIGVSTFSFRLAQRLKVKEFLLLGVDLNPTADGGVYPQSLGFESAIDNPRQAIWANEAESLGFLAKESSFSVKNLAKNGRNIPNTAKWCPDTANLEPSGTIRKLNPAKLDESDAFIKRLAQMHKDLCEIDYGDLRKSPLYTPFLEVYYNVYLSRTLYTGEFPTDSIILRIEYLKAFIEGLLVF